MHVNDAREKCDMGSAIGRVSGRDQGIATDYKRETSSAAIEAGNGRKCWQQRRTAPVIGQFPRPSRLIGLVDLGLVDVLQHRIGQQVAGAVAAAC